MKPIFSSAIVIAVLAQACGPKNSSIMADSNQRFLNPHFASGLIFTVLDKKMGDSGDILTLFYAGGIALAERYEIRPTGIVTLRDSSQNLMTLDDGGFHTIVGNVSCQSDACTFHIAVQGHDCPEVSFTNRTEYLIPCDDAGYLHLQSRSALNLEASASPQRSVINDFEFMTLGSLTAPRERVTQYVKADRPLVFGVDQELKQREHFIDDLLLAFSYWNTLIGFEALRYDPRAIAPEKFDASISIISLEHCDPCGGDARGQSYSDPITGVILSGKIDIYPEMFRSSRAYQQNTLAHELGHVLGLAHNFAASEDFQNAGTLGATSVMDYGDPSPLDAGLPYDRAVTQWIYAGRKPKQTFAHCGDREVTYKIGCSRSDTAETRKTTSKTIAASYASLLANDPDFIKKEFMDDSHLGESLRAIKAARAQGDKSWAIEYMDALSNYLGDIYVEAHKVSSFAGGQIGAETRAEWLKVLRFTINDPRATYSPSQREFLELTESVLNEAPINPATIDDFAKSYNEKVIRSTVEN